MDLAFRAAKDAFPSWRDMTPSERSLALLRIADAIESHAQALVDAECRNTGKPVALDHVRRDPAHGRPDPFLRCRGPPVGG